MSYERAELLRLVEHLPDGVVAFLLAEAKKQSELSTGVWPPEWFGAIKHETTFSARAHDKELADGFGQS